MSYDCVCWKTYVCLRCERIARGQERESRPKVARSISTARPVAQCGTRAGYNKHRRDGEPACAECKAAQNKAVIEFNKRKRAG